MVRFVSCFFCSMVCYGNRTLCNELIGGFKTCLPYRRDAVRGCAIEPRSTWKTVRCGRTTTSPPAGNTPERPRTQRRTPTEQREGTNANEGPEPNTHTHTGENADSGETRTCLFRRSHRSLRPPAVATSPRGAAVVPGSRPRRATPGAVADELGVGEHERRDGCGDFLCHPHTPFPILSRTTITKGRVLNALTGRRVQSSSLSEVPTLKLQRPEARAGSPKVINCDRQQIMIGKLE